LCVDFAALYGMHTELGGRGVWAFTAVKGVGSVVAISVEGLLRLSELRECYKDRM